MKRVIKGGATIRLAVAEVERILAALDGAKGLKALSGQRRQFLARMHRALLATKQMARDREFVLIPIELAGALLHCMSETQDWWLKMFEEFDTGIDVADE